MAPLRSSLSLSLLLGLVACGDKGGQQAMGSTSGGDEVGGNVTSNGLSMSSDPMVGPKTSGAVTTNPATSDGVTGDGTTDATAGSASTGGVECQIEQPQPGQCDAGKPEPPMPFLIGAMAPGAGLRGPGVLADDANEVFASSGCAFICEPDMGGVADCDIFAQDCGPGEKCNAWANDGGPWNATRCVPVAPNPDPVGEPCTVEGSGVSGVDSCVKGAMCFGVGDDNIGTCVELCSCSVDNPVCTTQNTTCTISNEGVLALCLPVCDPLALDACGAGDVCVASGQFFICVPDASGDVGSEGENCEFINVCDPGLFCGANAGGFPACDGGGCCTPYCNLAAPVCPQGFDCLPWYEAGTAPKCFEDVGACIFL